MLRTTLMNYQDPKIEIAERLKAGILKLEPTYTATSRHRSYVWDKFSRVFDGDQRLEYVCCRRCKWIYAHIEKHGTSSLIKHRCAASVYNPDYIPDDETSESALSYQSANSSITNGISTVDNADQENLLNRDNSVENDLTTLSEIMTSALYSSPQMEIEAMPVVQNTKRPMTGQCISSSISAKKPCLERSTGAALANNQLPSISVSSAKKSARLENLELRSRIEKHRAETQYWRIMKKKAELEVEKLILEQIKLRQELDVINGTDQEEEQQQPHPESMHSTEEDEVPNAE